MIGPIYPWRGGIAHSNMLLCENLSKKHVVKVLSFKRMFPSFLYPGKNQKEVSEKVIGLDVDYIIDSVNPLSWVKTFILIRKGKPDLLVLQWWTTFFVPSLFTISLLTRLFTKTKVSFVCQNYLPHEKRVIDKFLTKLVLRTAHFLIALSKQDVNEIKSTMPNAKVKYLIEPTYEKIFAGRRMQKAEAKKMLALRSRVILFFGIVRPYKGLPYLLRAMPKVTEKLGDVKLLIVGEFWQNKESYLEEIDKLGIRENVQVIDRYVSDNEAVLYMCAADVVVLPYISSTESGVIQLAYGLNIPIITTNVGGNADLIEDGRNGILVPPEDADSLADAIILYFEYDKEDEFRQEMEKRASIFSWDEEKEKIFFHGM